MKKICIITQGMLPVPAVKGGAVETLVEYILNCNEVGKKLDITVLSVEDEEAEKKSRAYKYTQFVYFKQHKKKYNECLMLFYKILKRIGIYIPPYLEYIDIFRFLRKNSQKYDLCVYEGGPTTQLPALNKFVEKDKLIMHLHWDGMGNRRLDSCFSYLISISDYIGKCWKNASGCKDDKIKLLPNCVDIAKFDKEVTEEEKEDLRKQLNIAESDYVLIFVGRIVKDKGVLELIKAYQLLTQKNVKLLLIGSANFGNKTCTGYEKEVLEAIENSNKPIIKTGYVHQNELYKFYAISDLAIMPSQFQEPAGLVALEALATRTPLVATRVGGLPEYVSEECAVLIDKNEKLIENLAKAIDEVLIDENRRENMSKTARDFARQYDVNMFYERFVGIISEISSN